MPNTYIENRERWQDLADVDYLGQFVKAWLAFNAWYRGAYEETRDRAIIDEVKSSPNSLRSRIVPLVESTSEEAEQFRGYIGALHHRLENFHLESGKGAKKARITFTSVYLRQSTVGVQITTSRGITYEITRGGAGVSPQQVVISVANNAGSPIFSLTQSKYDKEGLEDSDGFKSSLSVQQKRVLAAHYRECNPKITTNVTVGQAIPIQCGAYSFRCPSNDLFAAVIEVVYLMRCCLFHGELVPSREATGCYEPAFHIVRKFLSCLT